MKVSKLLEQHFSVESKIGLDRNFGDSYLCNKNKIFRNIRKAALGLGYSFSCERNDAYLALPLSQLATVLSTKKIPYVDNVSVLEGIESQIPNLANWDDIRDSFRKNFVLHESCHAVARKYAVNENPILDMLVEESFANSCELLAVVDAEQTAHKIFFEWNSYSALHEVRTNLKNAMNEIGAALFFKLVFFGYLHSNYLRNSIDEGQLNRVLKIALKADFSAKQLKSIKALLRICFTLDTGFKEVTTGFYMKLRGGEADHRQLAKHDFLVNFEKNSDYLRSLDSLIEVVTAG